jgi:hypothetical protein
MFVSVALHCSSTDLQIEYHNPEYPPQMFELQYDTYLIIHPMKNELLKIPGKK